MKTKRLSKPWGLVLLRKTLTQTGGPKGTSFPLRLDEEE